MSNNNPGITGDIGNFLRGLCMGCADIVPGISGGTLALILGHYHRLVKAFSDIDAQAIGLVRRGKLAEAAAHVDLRFLIGIACGMLTGIVALASLMHYLLEHQLTYTFAAFNGLILASSVIVARRLNSWHWSIGALACLGVIVAFTISIQHKASIELTPLTAFLSATVAICAMILPGISGAFILLLLGLYHPVTELIKGLPKGEISASSLLIIGCFAVGCLVGLLTFSRLLRWLLDRYHDRTLGFLAGLMLGSLYKIWPFQSATPETSALEFKEQEFVHLLPSQSEASLAMVVIIGIAAAGFTFLLERVGSQLISSDGESETAKG